ncbi:pre-16S rRNA-processing nuclease YqgF [Selenomonas sp. TAMA-11512]|uniref:pre-16S rRNA-processing nuclease YqgF n=1 Tax=Selenomonas sp. TAMA-11512 TaxID=3095337 RepID=UPI0030D02462
MMEGSYIAAIDPGREKCGFAVLRETGETVYQTVLDTSLLTKYVEEARVKYGFSTLLIGDGTTSREAQKKLPAGVDVLVVDEKHTTEEARRMYWKAHPPKGWRRLLPVTMQFPPVPVDDYVAVLLARRYIERL